MMGILPDVSRLAFMFLGAMVPLHLDRAKCLSHHIISDVADAFLVA